MIEFLSQPENRITIVALVVISYLIYKTVKTLK